MYYKDPNNETVNELENKKIDNDIGPLSRDVLEFHNGATQNENHGSISWQVKKQDGSKHVVQTKDDKEVNIGEYLTFTYLCTLLRRDSGLELPGVCGGSAMITTTS